MHSIDKLLSTNLLRRSSEEESADVTLRSTSDLFSSTLDDTITEGEVSEGKRMTMTMDPTTLCVCFRR